MEKKCLSMAMGYRDPPESQPPGSGTVLMGYRAEIF